METLSFHLNPSSPPIFIDVLHACFSIFLLFFFFFLHISISVKANFAHFRVVLCTRETKQDPCTHCHTVVYSWR